MFDKTEKWREDLLMKKETLKQNKEDFELTMKTLDEEKNKDLQKTVKEVDKNLGNIFSVLLQDTNAGLRPVYDGATLTGL